MRITRQRALGLGWAAIGGIIALQAFNSFACYGHGAGLFLLGLGFVAIPLVPALLALPSANPVRAVGACLLFAPWLAYAYYIDCIRPYAGGGASMVYVLVVMGGLPSSIIGALATGPVMRLLGIEVGGGQRAGTESRG
ncbi:MAG: Na+:solute symporter [Gammaproteobacteria bacterium]|nr:Na+:solute symporter [Gammaproteobacteria bacterium]